nr:MATE family efflux transporter [uncultured Marvinbryantia sp.]
MAKTIDMTHGKPSKLLLQFAFPVLIGNLFQQLYTLVDRVIVGQFVGADAFSAVGSTNALSMMFMSMCMGTAIGTGVVVSQYFGAKDQKNTAKAIANGAYVNVIVALIMTVIALLATKPILILLNTPATLMDDAVSYMRVFMGGLLAVSLYYTPFSILRALGDSKTPLIFLAFCSILNIILDIIFVVPLGMGVEGAAIATVMAQAIAAVLCMIYAFKKVPQFHDAVHYMKPDSNIIRQTLKVGIPTGFQYSLMYISSIALQRVVNGFGESVIGAFTSTTQIELLVQQIYAALGTAMVTYTGQNIGAGKTDRVKQGMCSAMKISGIVSVILLVVFWLGGRLIMSIFVPDKDIIALASSGIHITSLFFMALGVVQVLRYLLNGAGDSVYALVNGIVEIIARIGFAFLLTAVPFIGMWGIWLTTGLTWLVTAVFALWRYRSGAWMSKSLVKGKENE